MKRSIKWAGLLSGLMLGVTAQAETELTFWHGIESPQSVEVLEQKIADYEAAHPGVKIKAQNYGAADQVNAKIMIAVAGDRAPDLMWWAPAFTGKMAKTGKLVNIQERINNDPSFNADDIYSGLWDVSRYDGDIWTVPFDANNLALYYNKKHFAAAGIDPKSIQTWSDLEAAAAKLTTDDCFGFQVPMGKNEWTVWTWETLLWQAGGEFLSADGKTVAFNSKAGINALQFWYDLVNKAKVANFSEPDAGYKTDDFVAGRVSMMINGPWNYGALQQAKKDVGLDVGVLFLPKAGKKYAEKGEGRHATNIGGENLFLFKTDAERENASWEFAKFIMSPEFQVDWAIKTGYLPVCKSAQEDSKYKTFLDENEFIRVYAEQMQYGMARPSIPAYGEISKALGKEIEKALYGKSSAEKALKDAAKSSDRIISRQR
ncbi:MAG: ABC transporter substrate-binding protein [Spartobacteria bacterium]|nr:ABC transporter substrate-binding protein [Spartobacteria bacterium]